MKKIIIAILLALVTFTSCDAKLNIAKDSINLVISQNKELSATRVDAIAYYEYSSVNLSSEDNHSVGSNDHTPLVINSAGHAELKWFSTGTYEFTVFAYTNNGNLIYQGTSLTYITNGKNTVNVALGAVKGQQGYVDIALDAIKVDSEILMLRAERTDGTVKELTSFICTQNGFLSHYTMALNLEEGNWMLTFSLVDKEVIAREILSVKVVRNERVTISGKMYTIYDMNADAVIEKPTLIKGTITCDKPAAVNSSNVYSFNAISGTPVKLYWAINGTISDATGTIKVKTASGDKILGKVTGDTLTFTPPNYGTYEIKCSAVDAKYEVGYTTTRVDLEAPMIKPVDGVVVLDRGARYGTYRFDETKQNYAKLAEGELSGGRYLVLMDGGIKGDFNAILSYNNGYKYNGYEVTVPTTNLLTSIKKYLVSNKRYWSSTSSNATTAWGFFNGTISTANKSEVANILFVRYI